MTNHTQGVKIECVTIEFLNVNVPQGTRVLGPIMFTIMLNDIKAESLLNILSKFVEDVALMASVYDREDLISDEIENMVQRK